MTTTSSTLTDSSFTLGAQATSRSFVGSLAFLLYDILLTVDQEVDLLQQRAQWSPFKFLYLYVRYVPFLLQVPLLLVGTEITPRFHFDQSDCYKWEIYQGMVMALVMGPVDYILVARIYALYHAQPIIQIIVSISYIAGLTFMFLGLGLALPGLKYDKICHTLAVPNVFMFYGGGEVALQTVLFSLTLYKFIASLRQDGWRSVRGVPIMTLIVRDGTWAFFMLFGLVATQALVYLAGQDGGILYGWMLSSFSFCGYRILLNFTHLPRSRNTTTTTTSRLTTVVSQWTEHISPVSFGDWEADPDMRENEYEFNDIMARNDYER
ncbi:hypothetical protein K435DRAFT_863429 [Dendrothele bispora CBS 962.96]|uniref:DUF6533 domain-containing protein n=1 Tax=Dendrothele bispora (strain CBS 962.96) TaxID=1314807 RepID=A0A4V4HEK2_DENBC|nr:hypothetical protein K435DRAFT_863429 [Dendrothele bispora CBS 962.96]